jgi:hypothetical protein
MKSSATRKPTPKDKPRGAKRPTKKPAQPDFSNHRPPKRETADVIDLFTGQSLSPYEAACEALKQAMGRAPRRPIPHQDQLEAQFDASLDRFGAVLSQEITGLLRALGAEAAVLGDRMALSRENVSFQTLAHEAAHLLQVSQTAQTPSAQAEAEAETTAQGPVAETLPPDVLAFRSTTDAQDEDTLQDAERRFRAQKAAEEAQTDRAPEADQTRPDLGADQDQTDQDSAEDSEEGEQDQAADAPGIESDMPEMPPEAEEAKTALEASVTALEAAVTPEAYMQAFKDAPPSLKAKKQTTLDADLAALSAGEAKAFSDDQPDFTAKMSGDEADAPKVDPVTVPEAAEPVLEDQPPDPAPDPEIAETQTGTSQNVNAHLSEWAPPMADRVDPEHVAGAISDVKTTDKTIQTSPGPAPPVPQDGESDPKRTTDQKAAATSETAARQGEAARAVLDGPGPEQVEMREVEETVALDMEQRETALDETAQVEGADQFLSRDLDAETTALFDAHHQTAMQDSLSEADTEMAAMVTERDSKREAETAKAREDMATAEKDANDKQQAEVGDARRKIQDERQSTMDAQGAAVADMNEEARTENERVQGDIKTRVEQDEAKIAKDFEGAEKQAESKLNDAEKDAKAEKDKAEKEAEDKSWWDRAVDWVGEQLSKLGDLIGKIFDAVRAGINKILDGVKAIAFTLIDAAASFIKGAIELYGEFLKLAVTHIVGSVFPELAEKLNAVIDEGVRLAKAAVDKAAEGLKAAVNAIVDLYKKALNAILDFVEGALNTVLAVAQAALAGDWSEVARLIIDPILKMLGINKDDFYAFFSNAADGLMKIVNDPLAFLGHLLDTVVGGFKLFGQNFVDHLIGGVIGWLTGALGGSITMPEKWDLWGVLDIARQILGLTLDMMRRIAVRILGEAAVEKIEFFIDYAKELIIGGWGAFFDKIKSDLSGLFDMVMGELTTFLVEKVVKAGIVWLASLINPAGALVKLVLMIWDFVMWMKDNLARFVDIITTVVNGIVDIANGKVEPASKAIERVLGNLLAPAIDLIARLIGLGNVAGRVRKIIEKVRKRIEDAIVKLIRKVLAKFTGKGGGKTSGTDDTPGKTGALMTPKQFQGAGESHTLYLEEDGNDVVPTMRSTPTPVVKWLNDLKKEDNVAPYIKRENDKAPDHKKLDETGLKEQTERRTNAIAPHIADAIKEVGQLDKEGEQAQDTAREKPENLSSEKADVDKEAKETISALEMILGLLGIESPGEELVDIFEPDIAKMHAAYQPDARNKILKAVMKDATLTDQIRTQSWAQAAQIIASNPSLLPSDWQQPLHSGNALRDNMGFFNAIFETLKSMADVKPEDFNDKSYDDLFPADELAKSQTGYFQHYLLKDLTTGMVRDLNEKMLGPEPSDYTAWFSSSFRQALQSALKKYANKGEKRAPDPEFKKAVAGSPFKAGGIFETGEYKAKTYAFANSKVASKKSLTVVEFFDKTYTDKWQENITHMATRVRAADKGKHEWIPSSMSGQAMQATIDTLGSTPHKFGEAAQGFADLLYLQHSVRTDTAELVFSPEWVKAKNKSEKAPHLSARHTHEYGKRPDTAPTPTEWQSYYPNAMFNKEVPVLTGHSGGIYYRTAEVSGEMITNLDYKESQRVSSHWHGHPSSGGGVFGLAQELFAGDITPDTVKTFAGKTVGYFNYTVLTEASEASMLQNTGAGEPFQLYRFTFAGIPDNMNFKALIDKLVKQSTGARDRLKKDLAAIIGNFDVKDYRG